MGFFSEPSGTSALLPLNKEIMKTCLEELELLYEHDEENDVIFVSFEDWYFVLTTQGEQNEIFTVRVISAKDFPVEHVTQAYYLVNQWNMHQIFPKAFVLEGLEDNPEPRLAGELSFDYEAGCTKELVSTHLRAAISTGSQLMVQVMKMLVPTAED